MTKKEALSEFKELFLPIIKAQEKNGVDHIMRIEAWSNYTDALCKEGQITSNQYNNWTNPF